MLCSVTLGYRSPYGRALSLISDIHIYRDAKYQMRLDRYLHSCREFILIGTRGVTSEGMAWVPFACSSVSLTKKVFVKYIKSGNAQ